MKVYALRQLAPVRFNAQKSVVMTRMSGERLGKVGGLPPAMDLYTDGKSTASLHVIHNDQEWQALQLSHKPAVDFDEDNLVIVALSGNIRVGGLEWEPQAHHISFSVKARNIPLEPSNQDSWHLSIIQKQFLQKPPQFKR